MTKKDNQRRIKAARTALVAHRHFMDDDRQSLEEFAIDLLTDVRHLLQQEQIDVGRVLRVAELHADAEMDMDYNGWTNYETWAVHLWLTNDQGSYNHWRGEASRHRRETAGAIKAVSGVWGDLEAARTRLAKQLREECEKDAPLEAPSVFADLLRSALCEVDWSEIANAFLEELDVSD